MPNVQDKPYFWKIDRFNGGLSEDSRIGIAGAFRFGIGLDIRSDSGLLKVAKKPVEDSGGTVVKLIKWLELNPAANDDMYAYGENTIYKSLSGVWSVGRTLSSDSPNGQGLCDYDGYLYYRTSTQLGRFDYSSTWVDNWQTGLEAVSDFSPMLRFKEYLLIGHGRYVATVDDLGAFTLKRLTLPPGYRVRSMFRVGSYAAILAIRGLNLTSSEEGMCFLWGGNSPNYDDWIPIDGNPHAGIYHNNKMIIIAGEQPTIQESLGGPFSIMRTIPGVADGKYAEVYPGAIDLWRNMVHFGVSDGDSTTVVRAVYNWGAKNVLFDDALNAEFPTSNADVGAGTGYTGTGVQITAVKRCGTKIRFAWKDSSSYGVDEIDTSQYQAVGIYRTLAFDRESPYEKVGHVVKVEAAHALAANESITVKLSSDPYDDPTFADASTTVNQTESTVGANKLTMPLTANAVPIRGSDLHLELRLAGTGSTRPTVKRVWSELKEDTQTL